MRKWFYALPISLAGLIPFVAQAADVCSRVTGKGLLDGVCVECFAEGRCQIADFFIVGNTITKFILGISGSFVLLMIIYGGFLWLTSHGNSDGVESGKKVLTSSLIGLVIVFGAYSATQFLVAALVCQNGAACNVDEIFTRPFQVVKPPGGATVKPPTPEPINTNGAGTTTNPTAGNAGSGEPVGCYCSGEYTGAPVTEANCKGANTEKIFCTYAAGTCNCDGNVAVDESSCSADGVKTKFGIPSVAGVSAQVSCNWLKAN